MQTVFLFLCCLAATYAGKSGRETSKNTVASSGPQRRVLRQIPGVANPASVASSAVGSQVNPAALAARLNPANPSAVNPLNALAKGIDDSSVAALNAQGKIFIILF